MRIFVWHGYLLAGTGSNIDARQLSREWSRAGHEVTVFCTTWTRRASTSAPPRP